MKSAELRLKASTTVILANGQFPTTHLPLAVLAAAKRIICCDGAADKLRQTGLEPTWIVGDMDSLSAETRCLYDERVVAVAEQQSNDLAKAFCFCVTRGWRDVVILGATGLREDHTLSNLSWLVDFAREAAVLLLTDSGWFTPILGSTSVASYVDQPVSIFPLTPW